MTNFREGTEHGLKTCTTCSRILPASSFHKHPSGTYGVRNKCRQCTAEYDNSPEAIARRKRYRVDNPYYGKDYYLKRNFGIDLAWFNARLAEQEHKCAICGKPYSPKARFAIDHNHSTGELRGVLCARCNLFLGHVEKDPDLVNHALAYLGRYK